MNTVVSLNGEWELLWDTADTGILNRWYATHPAGGEQVQVPHVWERDMEKKLLSQDSAYYFKKFKITEKNAKRIFLNFSRIATHATVWLNGKFLGDHFGAYTSFRLDASKAIKLEEENLLCVRVANMGVSNTRIDFGRESTEGAEDRYIHPYEAPVGAPWSQYPFGGIFGDVSLIIGNAAFIAGVQVEPDTDQEHVAVEVSFNNPRGFQTRLRILMKNPSGDVSDMFKDLKLDKENASIRFTLGLKDWKREKCLWTLERPNVFAIELQIEGQKTKKGEPDYSFSVLKTFGFRKFDCINGDFYLNDSILKIQGVNYSQHWSRGGLWTTANPAFRKDLEAVKAAGFNAIRTGGAPLPEEALNICDEIGLLVFQELPIHTMRSSKRGLEILNQLIKDSVLEQKNHPCIAAWVLGSENGTMMLENGTKLLKEVDQYDISRPIISNLNCVYLDNEEQTKLDTGKLMGVTNDRTILFSSHRLHLRMNPSASLCNFLANYCSKEAAEELSVPDTTLGNSSFQDEYEEFVKDVSGKILITLKNHALFPATPTTINGSRGVKNAKAVKTLYKHIETFIADKELSIWPDFKAFKEDAARIALKSKIDQITALQSNPLVSGYILDQWADCGTDFSGLNDENRKSKGLENFERKITKPTRLLLNELEHTAAPLSEVQFQLTLLNNARLKEISVTMEILNESGKVVVSDSQKLEGTTSLTPLGLFTLQAPKTAGLYTLRCTLSDSTGVIDSVSEDLCVMIPSNTQKVLRQVCFLDNCSGTNDVLNALKGPEPIIFTANLSSWSEEILSQIINATKNGKTLLLSDMTQEDIEAFNASHFFEHTIESHFTTGAGAMSLHYVPENSPLREIFVDGVLDHKAAAVVPGVSLNALEGAEILARSVSVINDGVKVGVDLQILPFGNGKIIFNQFNIFEGLETNVLADALFCKIVSLA